MSKTMMMVAMMGWMGCGGSQPPASSAATAPSTEAPASTATTTTTATTTSTSAPTATSSTTPASSPPSSTAKEVTVGAPPPDFTAKAHDGTVVHLAALKGKPVVVYFYPKDETPGCTKEACSFRDAWDGLKKSGVVLVGVSGDSDDSHKGFATHHKLPFLLVSDPNGAIATSFGVPFDNGYAGRQSFVIGADGNVKKIYRKVDVGAHAKEITDDLR